eukprot:TRINITY_DN13096_c0_g1_i1.p1 TRINITY_DN13096_c0_g1~~TRINITY_DN13096_c0_g1_i1.p1  ORF type:complete len:128 (-),score=12.41 TRINITY_DN13096_c0_g1_i1:138-521(-)
MFIHIRTQFSSFKYPLTGVLPIQFSLVRHFCTRVEPLPPPSETKIVSSPKIEKTSKIFPSAIEEPFEIQDLVLESSTHFFLPRYLPCCSHSKYFIVVFLLLVVKVRSKFNQILGRIESPHYCRSIVE